MTHYLADHDGTLCVVSQENDYNEPRRVMNYWPTAERTHQFCRFFEVKPEELREKIKIRQVLPGTYEITEIDGFRHGRPQAINLIEGGKTRSIKVDFEPIPPPRVGKNTKVEWHGGYWHKCSPKGKWTRV